MEIQTRNVGTLTLDTTRWLISTSGVCKVLHETEDHYLIQNANNLQAEIPTSIVRDNELTIVDGHLSLPEGVYAHYVVEPGRKRANEDFNRMFLKHCELIFTNMEAVLGKAEYYLLRPQMLSSGAAYGGGFSYSLGALIESFKSGNHFYFDEFGGFKKMYLVATSGSPLSGSHGSTFWCAEDRKIVHFKSGEGPGLPKPFISSLKKFSEMLKPASTQQIDFQDQAIERLIQEIKTSQ